MHNVEILEFLLQSKYDDVFMELCGVEVEELIAIPIEKFKGELYEKHKNVLDKILDKKKVNWLIQIQNEHAENILSMIMYQVFIVKLMLIILR